MTRTELLSLADFVAQFSGTDYDRWAADLRKLAELRPVAWSKMRLDAPCEPVTFCDVTAKAWEEQDFIVCQFYQLSEVLTDD